MHIKITLFVKCLKMPGSNGERDINMARGRENAEKVKKQKKSTVECVVQQANHVAYREQERVTNQ